jgi:hypothetical protein
LDSIGALNGRIRLAAGTTSLWDSSSFDSARSTRFGFRAGIEFDFDIRLRLESFSCTSCRSFIVSDSSSVVRLVLLLNVNRDFFFPDRGEFRGDKSSISKGASSRRRACVRLTVIL